MLFFYSKYSIFSLAAELQDIFPESLNFVCCIVSSMWHILLQLEHWNRQQLKTIHPTVHVERLPQHVACTGVVTLPLHSLRGPHYITDGLGYSSGSSSAYLDHTHHVL